MQAENKLKVKAIKDRLFEAGISCFPNHANSDLWVGITKSVSPELSLQELIYLQNDLYPIPVSAEAAENRRMSTGSEQHVYCLIDSVIFTPLGTTFAISPELLLSANHNRLDPDTFVACETLAATTLLKKKGEEIVRPIDIIPLEVVGYHVREDWVVLKRTDGGKFASYASLCEEDDLPNEHSLHNQTVTIRHYNAGIFRKKLKQCHRNAVVLNYQECYDLEGTVNEEVEAELVVEDGGVRGVCGAPYFYNDKYAAFHVESDSESIVFDFEKNIMEEIAKSITGTHSHFSVGRVLCRLPAYMELYASNFDVTVAESIIQKQKLEVAKLTTVKGEKGLAKKMPATDEAKPVKTDEPTQKAITITDNTEHKSLSMTTRRGMKKKAADLEVPSSVKKAKRDV